MTDERVSDVMRESLRALRQGLLRLHKALLDLERRDYERARGRIGNSYEFLQLVLKDPWFDWLHRLSELIVQIDETLDPDARDGGRCHRVDRKGEGFVSAVGKRE